MGAERVGCIGRRSPGRSGGRGAPAPCGPCGRGRWKIGCPGTGRPGAGRIVPAGALVCAAGVGATGRGGALYTGRGPVCGTIILGAGGCGAADTVGGAGRGTGGVTGITGDVEAAIGGAAGGGATTAAAGGGGGAAGRTGGATTAGAAGTGGGGAGTAGFSVAGATTVGRAGAGDGGAATVAGAAGFTTGGTIVGFGVAGGGAGFAGCGTAAASFFCVIALSTSPGREMWDRSILVLISSSPRSVRAARADELCDSAEPRI